MNSVPTRLEGMETPRNRCGTAKRKGVPTRLEGMETYCLLNCLTPCLRFRPDLRGWKHTVSRILLQNEQVPTRLEGMETDTDAEVFQMPSGSDPT